MIRGGPSKKESNNIPPVPLPLNLFASELSSYEAACKHEPVLQAFDSTLNLHTKQIINSLATGIEIRSISFDSLREVTGCLLEMNQEVVKLILDCKEDIWNHQSMSSLVDLYFQSSTETLDFFTKLEVCLRRARTNQLMIIQFAVQQFEKELKLGKGFGGDKKFKVTLEELKKFRETGNPFTKTFFDLFDKVYKQQVSLLEKLHMQKRELDKKLKTLKTWRRVSNMVFVAAFISVLIFSVVVVAVAAPPVMAALTSALSVPIGSVGKWCDHLWKKYEKAIKGQKEIIASMNYTTYLTIKDMENINVLLDRLEGGIGAMQQKAELALRDEEMVKVVMEEIKKQLESFEKSIEDLHGQVDKVSSFITKSRTVILQRIIKYPNNSASEGASSW